MPDISNAVNDVVPHAGAVIQPVEQSILLKLGYEELSFLWNTAGGIILAQSIMFGLTLMYPYTNVRWIVCLISLMYIGAIVIITRVDTSYTRRQVMCYWPIPLAVYSLLDDTARLRMGAVFSIIGVCISMVYQISHSFKTMSEMTHNEYARSSEECVKFQRMRGWLLCCMPLIIIGNLPAALISGFLSAFLNPRWIAVQLSMQMLVQYLSLL